jgi:hypothetical protein
MTMSWTSVVGGTSESTKPRNSEAVEASGSTHVWENPVMLSGVSYAVAIYPYMAERDDEIDVVV